MSLGLTSRGEAEAMNVQRSTSPEVAVIAFMYMVGKPVEMEEIVDELHTSDEKALRLIQRLISLGYVEEV